MWFKISKVSTTGGYGCTRSFRQFLPSYSDFMQC